MKYETHTGLHEPNGELKTKQNLNIHNNIF